jgi:hypothetical protein
MSRNQFPHDNDNRIQKLYYDVAINTIFNRTKLQNVKNKFWKYLHYLEKYEQNNIQPKLLEFGCRRDTAYCEWQRAKRISLIHNPTPENVEKRKALVPIFRKADEEYELMLCEQYFYDQVMDDIHYKIYEIKTQQLNIYKHYRKCGHCEKKDMVYISGCKSKHKLCSVCSDDITKCPVCEDDLGLQYCAICMENKKKIVETGCENKHQTCKECLDKIKQKNNNCPFCRGCCSKEPVAIPDYWRERSEEEDEALAQEWVEEEYWREREEAEEEHRRYREWQEEEDRRDREETEEDRSMSRRERE